MIDTLRSQVNDLGENLDIEYPHQKNAAMRCNPKEDTKMCLGAYSKINGGKTPFSWCKCDFEDPVYRMGYQGDIPDFNPNAQPHAWSCNQKAGLAKVALATFLNTVSKLSK